MPVRIDSARPAAVPPVRATPGWEMGDRQMADAAGDIDRLILDAATGRRRLTSAEIQQVLEHVARAGFDPNRLERARGRLAGLVWQGRTLAGHDLLLPAEVHYLRHVVRQQEWPAGTSLAAYVESIGTVLLDEASGVFTSRYQGAWQLGVVRRSGTLRGPGGFAWVLVEYRVATGPWVTAYQPEQRLGELHHPRRSDLRWLRQLPPTSA